jgi:hypothetical protein
LPAHRIYSYGSHLISVSSRHSYFPETTRSSPAIVTLFTVIRKSVILFLLFHGAISILFCLGCRVYCLLQTNAALICLTMTAFYYRKPRILYEEPTTRKPKLFANAEGHDLARCYAFYVLWSFEIGQSSFPNCFRFVFRYLVCHGPNNLSIITQDKTKRGA